MDCVSRGGTKRRRVGVGQRHGERPEMDEGNEKLPLSNEPDGGQGVGVWKIDRLARRKIVDIDLGRGPGGG